MREKEREPSRATVDYGVLFQACRQELLRGAPRQAGLQLVCDLLRREVSHYDWFGLYIAVPEERMLVLGPFSGSPTEHVRIPYGRGICGQAAERAETFLVDDVSAQENYLACSLSVRSEIVVPIFGPPGSDREGVVIGEIDIDSHRPGAFSGEDQRFLQDLALEMAPFVPRVPSVG
ncbi:GAF domain-containing protein [Alkalispirochaeta americana]|uniref:GAF domain-containing protein n=1 Tax=Alkalispirochaeta americana TaxID=159291 RepID=A0A1N6NBB4_9SPIO|nr:GAF domain-containing protein [Alkalispirochaeta americana]SIP89345.1 GAF domain-containing protein [Alkalispirochaeta americana]